MTEPCGTCSHFDVVVRSKKETSWGWCARYSIYPFKEGPGQIFPPGVKRVASAEDLAQPRIVKKLQVVDNCPHYAPKKPRLSKVEMIEKAQTKKHKTVLR